MSRPASVGLMGNTVPNDRRPVRFEDILEKVQAYLPDADIDLLRRAYVFSALYHKGQIRSSGEPYLVHPLEVSYILADLRLDLTCVISGFLHDIIEDTLATRQDIEAYFGTDIADIVEGLSKISRIQFTSREEQQAENFRKMLLAMVDDIRVILVRLADRLHNMRTLKYLSKEQQERIAQETLEIYAPIAGRLGIYRIRSELEDLSFLYLSPVECRELVKNLKDRRKFSADFIAEIQKCLADCLAEHGIQAEITGRVKRLFSIHRKMKEQNIGVNEVYDFVAFRVITQNTRDCYGALGAVHGRWRPVPDRIKDYIAMPKPNMYQSLHTSVMTGRGHPFEVQIRTQEMHRIAEEGIAAHWKYKEGKAHVGVDDLNVQWLRQILEWQKEVKDPREFLKLVKVDLYPEEVYTFTPRGKVVSFPRGATPIDFAYLIHTEVGHQCVGAKINGRMVPLKTHLRNGDVIEIMTSKSHRPSADWLNLAKTSGAKSKIRHFLNVERRKRSIEVGKNLAEKKFKQYRVDGRNLASEGPPESVLAEMGYASLEDFFAAVGYGKVTPGQLIQKLRVKESVKEKRESKLQQVVRKALGREQGNVIVRGMEEALVFLAKCCNPILGEPIVGYITRGRGVSVHSYCCPNVEKLLFDPERKIEVKWESGYSATFLVNISIQSVNRPGLLARITSLIAGENSNIIHVDARTIEVGKGIISLTLEVSDLGHLRRILDKLRGIEGIHSVERLFGGEGVPAGIE